MVEKWTEIKKGLEEKRFFTNDELSFLEALARGTQEGTLYRYSDSDDPGENYKQNVAFYYQERTAQEQIMLRFADKLSRTVMLILEQFYHEVVCFPVRVDAGYPEGINAYKLTHAQEKLTLFLNNPGSFENWREVFESARRSSAIAQNTP